MYHSAKALRFKVLLMLACTTTCRNLQKSVGGCFCFDEVTLRENSGKCTWLKRLYGFLMNNVFLFFCLGRQSLSLARSWTLSRKWLTLQLELEVRWDLCHLCLSLCLSRHKQTVVLVLVISKTIKSYFTGAAIHQNCIKSPDLSRMIEAQRLYLLKADMGDVRNVLLLSEW